MTQAACEDEGIVEYAQRTKKDGTLTIDQTIAMVACYIRGCISDLYDHDGWYLPPLMGAAIEGMEWMDLVDWRAVATAALD